MKNWLKLVVLGGGAFFFWEACTKGEISAEDGLDIMGQQVLQCTIAESEPATKTALLPNASTVVWQTKDAISVLSESGTATFSLVSGAGKTTASFAGKMTESGPYTAIHPASKETSVSEGTLFFQLPERQVYVNNSFGTGAAPMVASFDDFSSPLQFKNLCGMLCLKLTAKPSLRVSRLLIEDHNDNNMLWGECRLTLDGTQGTNEQKLSLEGGDNKLTVMMSSPIVLSESVPTKIFVVVPSGSFRNGFSVTVFDDMGTAYTTLRTDHPEAVVEQSKITNMSVYDIKAEAEDPLRRGYYKDLFMDSGICLNSFTYLAVYSYIGWDYEYFATPYDYESYTYTDEDLAIQRTFFEMAEDDENGYILYPDRQPRFRCIFVNGGSSRKHGNSLGIAGRQTIYDFVYNGGSYVGTCAGAFLACRGYDSYKDYEDYFGIFPGHIYHTKIYNTYTDLTIPAESPLRTTGFSFGESVTSIRHNDGGYMSEALEDIPAGTEILSRYSNCPAGKESNNGKVAIWAYKPSEKTGRIVVTGSHPEKENSGNRRDLFAAMLLYAAAGSGTPPVKATLTNGDPYACTSLSSENTPEHARIGDKQYHHFTVEIPEGAHDLKIDLESPLEFEDEDLYLSLRKGNYAWFSESSPYALTTDGTNKTLSFSGALEAGTWYISVYSPNTVTTTVAAYTSPTYGSIGSYYKYIGRTRLLNGIPYTITATWKE